MEQQIEQLNRTIDSLNKKIESLQLEMNSLKATTTIPFDTANAFTDRIINETFQKSAVTSPTADGYLIAIIGGQTMYIPKYK